MKSIFDGVTNNVKTCKIKTYLKHKADSEESEVLSNSSSDYLKVIKAKESKSKKESNHEIKGSRRLKLKEEKSRLNASKLKGQDKTRKAKWRHNEHLT